MTVTSVGTLLPLTTPCQQTCSSKSLSQLPVDYTIITQNYLQRANSAITITVYSQLPIYPCVESRKVLPLVTEDLLSSSMPYCYTGFPLLSQVQIQGLFQVFPGCQIKFSRFKFANVLTYILTCLLKFFIV